MADIAGIIQRQIDTNKRVRSDPAPMTEPPARARAIIERQIETNRRVRARTSGQSSSSNASQAPPPQIIHVPVFQPPPGTYPAPDRAGEAGGGLQLPKGAVLGAAALLAALALRGR